MKTSASLLVLALTMAAGACVHRLVDNNHAAPEEETEFTQPDPTPAAKSTMPANVADELLAARGDSNVQERDEILSALTAGEFPALATEMLRQGKYLGEIVEYWALADAQGLLVFAEKNAPNDLRTVVEHCFASEPVLVLAMIQRIETTNAKLGHDLTAAALYAEADPATTITAAVKLGIIKRPDFHDGLCTVVQRWARQDAAAALAFGEKHPDYLPSVLEGWTVADPDAAVSWWRSRQESLGAFLIERMIEILAKTHPKEAGRFVELVENKNDFYASQASGLAEEPVAELAAWLETVPEEWRKDAYVALCNSFSNSRDPEKAAFLCMTFPEFASIEYSDQSLIAWSRQDPMAAIRHFQAGDIPPAVTERVLPELVDAWMRVDRKAALAFISTQPPNETLGRIMLDATHIVHEGDHEASRDFAMTLPALSMRIGACRQILSRAYMAEDEKTLWTASIPDAAVREALLLPPPAKPEETQTETEGKETPADPFTNDP